MPRKPLPRPEAELAEVRHFADLLDLLEKAADLVRQQRNAAMLVAKLAGATGEHLAEAARIARQNVHTQLTEAGYKPGQTVTPPR